jgi:ABC-2 type transport system ATP-binding protein
VIQVHELTKQLGNTRVLKGLSFNIPEKCITGLLGPNGAGKTTTIKILSTLLSPTSGSVIIDGLDTVEQAHEVRKRLGFLPEDPPLYSELTVLEQLRLSGGLYQLSGEKLTAAINSSLERCQLGDVAKQYIFKLSKGFRQRVGIAQAILHNPKVVILDEPTNGLDPIQLVEARSVIRSLSETATVIFSSHLLQEVVEVCSKVILIAHGEKLLETELDQSADRPLLEKQFIQAVQGTI